MKLTLNIWRQKDKNSKGQFENYKLNEVSPDMSFLEMLDVLNEDLLHKGDEPVAFDHDCREGICGACSMTINGRPHGPEKQTTTCQLHMRKFNDGETITIEPFRAKPFPVIRDLIVDRTSFDRIQQAGGFVSVNTMPIAKVAADKAFDAAACIGCGACVAACPNGAAMLFTSAKIGQFALLPQGQPERKDRVIAMVKQMDEEGFGACTNHYECEAACPKGISVEFIAMMNRDFMKASFTR
jgi:succinate dehydrogenase / fumarate reductase iron-sulfur subunit